MAASIEHQLLSKIISDGNLREVLDAGIDSDKFGSIEARLIFDYLFNYFHGQDTRNLVPTLDIVQKAYPTVELPHTNGRYTIKALCKELKQDWKRRKIEDILLNIESDYMTDPDTAINLLVEGAKNLQSTESVRDRVLSESTHTLINRYMLSKESSGMVGLPYPRNWGYMEDGRPKLGPNGRHKHPLNECSRGLKKEDFIVIYGRPKSMKTWLLIDILKECYWENKCRVLVFSGEMSHEQMMERSAARFAKVPYDKVLSGSLSQDDEEHYLGILKSIKEDEDNFSRRGKSSGVLFTDLNDSGLSLPAKLSSLQSKIEKFGPDVILADSIYTTGEATSRTAFHQQMLSACGTLKSFAKEYQIPIVVTSQANRKGEEVKGRSTVEVAYSDAFAQYADALFRTIKVEDADGNKRIALLTTAAREFDFPGLLLEAEPATKFDLVKSFRSQIQIQALLKAEEEAIAREEAEASQEISKKKHLKSKTFERREEGA